MSGVESFPLPAFIVVSTGAVPPLSVGAVLGDSDAESQAWKRDINTLGKRVAEVRQGLESPLSVNVVFHVDGKLAPNEFTGVRTARFSKANRQLMVQAAVDPASVSNRRAELATLLMRALDEAEAFGKERGLCEDLNGVREVAAAATSE